MTAVVLAVVAALCTGVAAAAQHHATHQVDRRPPLHPGIVLALLRRPWWLAGSAAAVVGLALQIAALVVGSIIVVQAIMISSVAWTVLGEALWARRRPGGRTLVGVGLAGAGVAGFLVLLHPRVPPAPPPPTVAMTAVVGAGCAAVSAAGLLWAARGPERTAALGLAVPTGVGYGLAAALMKLVSAQVRSGGWAEPFHHPALYTAVVVGPAAVLLSQNTLQRGRSAAAALTIVLLLDPLVGVATGVLWFGEQLTAGVAGTVGAVACVAAAVAGCALAQVEPPARRHTGATATDDPGAVSPGRLVPGVQHRRPVRHDPLGTARGAV